MFFKYPDIEEGSLAPEKDQRVIEIAAVLPKSEIVSMQRRFVELRGADGDVVTGDVAPGGFTVYLGGFDWVTFPTPQHVLLHYPELMPLPQQPYRPDEDLLTADI